jgi:hypothetical protein
LEAIIHSTHANTMRTSKFRILAISFLSLGLFAPSPAVADESNPTPALLKLLAQSDAVAVMVVEPAEKNPIHLGRLWLGIQTLYKAGVEPYNSGHALGMDAPPGSRIGDEFLVCLTSTINQSSRVMIAIGWNKNADGSRDKMIELGDDLSDGKTKTVLMKKIDLWFKSWRHP